MNLKYLPVLLIIALINSCIELELSAPSFLDIATHFHASESMVGLTISYNLLGFCIASIIYGPLSEVYGRRKVMLIGNTILSIGAIGCVITPSINCLIIARFIQGLGAATSAVIVSAIIADVYKTNKATKLYGLMNAIFTTLMASAPIVGGFINKALGWRGSYGFMALICIISLVILYLFLPETLQKKHKLNLKQIAEDYKKIFSNSTFLFAASIPSLLYGCYMTFVALAPFLYMETWKLNILNYTLYQGVIVAAFAITSIFASQIVEYFGISKTIYFSIFLIIGGALLMLTTNNYNTMTVYMSLYSIGSALLYPIIFPRSLKIFPKIKGTSLSGIMAIRYLLCSGLTGIASYLYDTTALSLTLVIATTTVVIVAMILFIHRSPYFR